MKRLQLRKSDKEFLIDLLTTVEKKNISKVHLSLEKILTSKRPLINNSTQCSYLYRLIEKILIFDNIYVSIVNHYGYRYINDFTDRLCIFWDSL